MAYQATKRAWAFLQVINNRHIEVEGTKQASLESNASYQVEPLGKTVPDALADLPVESAEDLAA